MNTLNYKGYIARIDADLDEYLEDCKQRGKDPNKPYSGKFNLRLSPQLHSEIAAAAAKTGKSLNQWVITALEKATLAS